MVWETLSQHKVSQVASWKIDGAIGLVGQQLTSKLTDGRHLVKARLYRPTGAPVEISATAIVATEVSVTTGR